MSYIGYIYSADESIKISHLKSGNYSKDIDVKDVSKLVYDNNIKILVQDEFYHQKFLSIPSKPYILYTMGNLDLLNSKIIGMVGPRKPSEYANKIIKKTLALLSNKQNISTISGLADGIDELVHNESINNNIPTIAVLGGGLSYFINGTKRSLLKKIIDNGGLIISEFKLKQKPALYTFPQRNRIVAGLSDMIFLAEASDNSGSLITVNFGLQMQKPVFVVPGDIYTSTSLGSNKLLNKAGVHAIYDINHRVSKNFDSYIENTGKHVIIDKNKYNTLTEIQKNILQYISDGEDTFDKILIKDKSLDYDALIFEITSLEIEEYIYSPLPGKISIK